MIELGRARFADSGVHVMYLHGHANIGYGAAHNLVLHGTGADYHLVLNPDVELAADALVNAVRWLDAHPDVGALAPAVADGAGNRAVPVQALSRGLRPVAARLCAGASCSVCFARRLARYEMRDIVDADPPRDAIGVPVAVRRVHARRGAMRSTAPAASIRRFFLYFEDFDWSVRLNE